MGMEPRPSKLDRPARLLLGRPTRMRGMWALAFGGVIVVVVVLLYVFEAPRSGSDVLELSILFGLALRQALTGSWHLLYDRDEALARPLGWMALFATIVCLVLFVTYILWFSPNPLLGSP